MQPINWTTDYNYERRSDDHVGKGGPGEAYRIVRKDGVWVLWGIGSYDPAITDLAALKRLAERSRRPARTR